MGPLGEGPPNFLRVFFAATCLSVSCLHVRYAFGAIACNVKYEQSTSELPGKQRSRVSERNPNGNLTTSSPKDSDTLGHKMLAGAMDSALLRSKPPSGVALSGRQSPSKSLEHPVLISYYYCVPGCHMSRLETQRPTKRLSPHGHTVSHIIASCLESRGEGGTCHLTTE